MKAFSFRLARVLELRRLEAFAERAKLEQALADCARLESRIREWEQVRAEETRKASVPPGATVLITELEQRAHFADALRRQRRALDQELAAAREAALAQQARFADAERACQLLEKLRDKQRAAWEAALAKELDELAADSHRAPLQAEARRSMDKDSAARTSGSFR